MLKHLLLGLLASQAALSMRYVMYIDEYVSSLTVCLPKQSLTPHRWHTKDLPGRNETKGITHAVMAFAKSDSFTAESAPDFKPLEPVSSLRERFEPDTKVMFAIGGWGDTEGFGKGSKDEKTREQYAKNVAKVVEDGGFDGVGMSLRGLHRAGTVMTG